MNRLSSRTLSFVIGALAAGRLCASPAFTPSPEEIEARMEQSLQKQQRSVQAMVDSVGVAQSVQRQQRSVAAMADSLANQQRALTKQRDASLAADFFQPPAWLHPGSGQTPSGCDSLPSDTVDSLIDSAAKNSSVAPELIRGVMQQESAFRPCAVSPKGAVGLMQLEPATAAGLGVKNPFDPADNVLGGARLLRQLLDRYAGDLPRTLSAYNAGSGRVDAAMGIPAIPETINYVKKILEKLPASSPLKQGIEKSSIAPVSAGVLGGPLDDQFELDSAPATNFWLIGSDGGQ
ncbi:MAG TPA: lytic transglycosylase domain-containing protein [Bryobacteraceae bacterium]|nr:lytic transglycosylase domain-containing protein [Bryobacteraceae bacterium]